MMQVHNIAQGSQEWLSLRSQNFCASEAPAMMGDSPYQTRNELLHAKHIGLTEEVSQFQQGIYDDGHAVEEAFRPIAEEFIGEDLYPVVGTAQVDGLALLASLDGLTLGRNTAFEHKQWNAETARTIQETGEPPLHHCWQLEQQLLLTGASRTLFVTSNGTADQSESCFYVSKPERRAALLAGWKQFQEDLANYVPPAPTAPAPVGRTPENLPALRIELTGAVTTSNLGAFKDHALAVFAGINRQLDTDQEFADAEKTVKWCEDVEKRLAAAKQHALSQTADIDALFRAVDEVSAEARRVRLELDKLVTRRKQEIREEIVRTARATLTAHIVGLNERIGRNLMTPVLADFDGAIKGKRNLDSMRNAVDTEVAKAKIAASAIADLIQSNLRAIEAAGHMELFADLQALVQKDAEHVALVIKQRVEANEAAVKAREDAAAAKAAQVIEEAKAAPVVPQSPVTSQVADQIAAPVMDNSARIKLGEICLRLGFTVTADFLLGLGFAPVATEKAAKLYRESDFNSICHAMVRHINTVAAEMLTA